MRFHNDLLSLKMTENEKMKTNHFSWGFIIIPCLRDKFNAVKRRLKG